MSQMDEFLSSFRLSEPSHTEAGRATAYVLPTGLPSTTERSVCLNVVRRLSFEVLTFEVSLTAKI